MDKFESQRKELVNILKQKGIKDKAVLDALLHIPRHLFVSSEHKGVAYGDFPLPIGANQTISQPYTVAFMLQALELKKGDKVLEIGTGSGWNAALIAYIISPGKIYTTEVIPNLIKLAKKNISKTKLENIEIIKTDGSRGYKKQAPYDKIIITAASPSIVKPWQQQLKETGVIVAPVGTQYGQVMIKARKVKGKLQKQELGYFTFVPLKGKYGWK